MVYFIKCGKRVKIGHAMDPRSRLRDLQVGNPEKLELLMVIEGGRRTECEIHKRFAEQRLAGEWFRIEGDLREYMAKVYREKRSRISRQRWKRERREKLYDPRQVYQCIFCGAKVMADESGHLPRHLNQRQTKKAKPCGARDGFRVVGTMACRS